jgi:hypothetical protein
VSNRRPRHRLVPAHTQLSVRSAGASDGTIACHESNRQDWRGGDHPYGDEAPLTLGQRRLELRHARASGGWLLVTRGAIVRPGRTGAGARHALPRGALQLKTGARVHHRRAAGVNGRDDLLWRHALDPRSLSSTIARTTAISGTSRLGEAAARPDRSARGKGNRADSGRPVTPKRSCPRRAPDHERDRQGRRSAARECSHAARRLRAPGLRLVGHDGGVTALR